MPAPLEQLVTIRSQIVEELLDYLDDLAGRMAELPPYYPEHLRMDEAGRTRFDDIRQMVQVVEDRSAFEKSRAEERERARAAGSDYHDRRAYAPHRSRPEFEDDRERKSREDKRPKAPPPPIKWDEHAGTRFKRAIVLGDPGFGKTWLLRYEARRLARQAAQQVRERSIRLDDLILPLFQRLSDLNRSEDPLEHSLLALVGKRFSDAFSRFVQKKLKTEHCVLLLDAWDEVPVEQARDGQPISYEPHRRQRLGQRLDVFAHQFPQVRLLLSSRIVGYSQSPISNAQELELLAFDTPQIESFVRVWFEKKSETVTTFQTMLRQNHQVRGLARIPLMLALMCRAYQEEALSFPTRRVELYDRCLRGLLRDWKAEKDHATTLSDVEAMLELLQDLSYRLFAENYEQFSESVLREKIGIWQEHVKRTHELADRKPTDLIEELKRDGILITAGEHRDAPLLFLHRTFHEYLTASHLARLANTGNGEGWETAIEVGDKTCTIRTLVDKKAWAPGWREVITLLAGQLDNPAPLLKLLIEKKKDDLFRHRLALSALCLPELKPEIRKLSSGIISYITTTIFSFWLWKQAEGSESVLPYSIRVLRALGQVNGEICNSPMSFWLAIRVPWINCLTPKAEDGVSFLESLCQKLQAGNAARRSWELNKILKDSLYASFFPWKAEILEEIGEMRIKYSRFPKIIREALFEGLIDSACTAANTLEVIGEVAAVHSEQVIPELVRTVLNESDGDLRYSAVAALGEMNEAAAAHPEVLPTLVAALHDCNRRHGELDPDLRRWGAAMALWAIGEAATVHPKVFPVLVTAVLYSRHPQVSFWATRALGVMRTTAKHSKVFPALVSALRSNESRAVRSKAARALGAIGEGVAKHPKVLPALITALSYADKEVRSRAAEALGEMGEGAATHPEVLPALVAVLRYADDEVRSSAAKALEAMGKVAAIHSEVLPGLVAAFQDKDRDVRSNAVRALGTIGEVAARHPDVLPALVAALRDEDWNVRSNAARVLGTMGEVAARHPDVLPALLNVVLEDGIEVSTEAAKALEEMSETAVAHPDVLPTLLKALRDKNWTVRRDAALALGAMGEMAATYPEVLSSLVRALYDRSRTVRLITTWTLWRMGKAAEHPEVFSTLLKALHNKDETLCSIGTETLKQLMAGGIRIFKQQQLPFFPKYEGRTVEELSRIDG